MKTRLWLLAALVTLLGAADTSAQGWNGDARRIALGGVGSNENLASKMIEEDPKYRVIPLPLGLLQIFGNLDKFDPSSDKFDPIRAVEYASSPLHYIVGRDSTDSGEHFVSDIRNARLSRDLNDYRGFVPAPNGELVAEGLANPNWGGTIKVYKGANGAFQGIYIGTGPYMAVRTATTIDPQLRQILASSGAPVYIPNAQFFVTDATRFETALAITGGYRAKFSLSSQGISNAPTRDGVYVALNYNYLRGLWYEDVPSPNGLQVRLDTDSAGLLTVPPCALGIGVACVPVSVTRNHATDGRGSAVDLGVGVVTGPWEVGFGANGISNYIEWENITQSTYSLGNAFTGNNDFAESPESNVGSARVELPVDYRGNIGFRTPVWSAFGEVGDGFNGRSYRLGVEEKFGPIAIRQGAYQVREKWNFTGGLGMAFSPRVWLDVATFGTTANIERKRQMALAFSIRINTPEPQQTPGGRR